MRRTLPFLFAVVVLGLGAACGTDSNTNNSGATRNSVIETNAHLNRNMNANTAPSNVGVVTNNNGNPNTSGVSTINSNNSSGNRNGNSNRP